MSERKAYPSDLTDAEWEILAPLIPAISEEATVPTVARREIVNGILYVLRSGCPWRLMPHDLPAWGTVYHYFRTWRKAGIWDQALEALRKQMRQTQGRDEEPSAAVIDSQSIKTSAVRGSEKGYDGGKQIWGRKRHLLVDTQGNLMEVKVTGASDSDLAGGKKLVEPLQDRFPRMQLLWGDSHYGGKFLEWVKEHLGWTVQTVRRLGTAPDEKLIEPKTKTKVPREALPSCPEDGWWNAALPGSPAGVAWPATMRAYLRPARPSSRSRPPVACFPISLLLLPELSRSYTLLVQAGRSAFRVEQQRLTKESGKWVA